VAYDTIFEYSELDIENKDHKALKSKIKGF